jgi:hypothetical protein
MKFLFVWIPKTAGCSLHAALSKLPHYKEVMDVDKTKPLDENYSYTFAHSNIIDIQRENPSFYMENYYKFSFVRSPYSRLVSLFSFLKRKGKFMRSVRGFKKWGFKRFIAHVVSHKLPPAGIDYRGHWFFQANKQVDWLYHDGKCIVDDVFHFETLNEDIQTLSKKIGVDIELEHLNATKHKEFQEYYDAKTKALVDEFYHDDFVAFKYDKVL